MSDHLATRNKSKAKKPRFERGQSGIMPQLKGTWRRPRGIHNKMRLGLRGKRVGPAVGYRSPNDVRGLERDGTKTILVENLSHLQSVKTGETILLSASLGLRKKVDFVKKALEKKLNILNLKDPAAFLQEIENKLKQKKKEVKAESKKVETKKAEPKKETEKQQ